VLKQRLLTEGREVGEEEFYERHGVGGLRAACTKR
jgi:hypothetical protein